MIRCLVPGHQGKQETREIHIRSVAYYVSNQRHKDHGRTLKLNGCLKCIAVKRLELWKDYVARTSKQYDAETVRFFVVRSHYRSPLNYSDVHLQDARGALRRLYTALQAVVPVPVAIDWANPFATRFKAAMD